MNRESLGYSSQRILDYCPVDIHRESLGYSSQRVLDYCPVDSQGVAGLFFSAGSRLLFSRFTGSRWVILLNGFKTIVQQMNRESLGYSSRRILDYCPVDILRESLGYSSQRVLDYCQQIHRESPGYSSQRVLDYCSVDSQGAAGLFFSMGSRQLSSRFTGSRWVILLNGFQTIVQQRFTGSRWVFLSTGSRLLPSRFTGSRWVILLNGFKTIVQQIHRESLGYSSQRILYYCPVDIHRESLGYSSQRVLDYYPVDSQGVAGLFFSAGSRLLFSRFTGSRWVILLNRFQTIVQQIFTGSR